MTGAPIHAFDELMVLDMLATQPCLFPGGFL
jgi:hypothetical protein